MMYFKLLFVSLQIQWFILKLENYVWKRLNIPTSSGGENFVFSATFSSVRIRFNSIVLSAIETD